MNNLKKIILSVIVVLGLAVTPVMLSTTAQAATTPKEQICLGSGGVWDAGAKTCTNANSGGGTLEGLFKNIVNILLYVIGAISVIMIVIGGFRYVVSGGDSSSVTGAKNTIFYAIIGLAVSIAAYAIVNFVVTNVG